MSERKRNDTPPTLVGYLFRAADSMARKYEDAKPVGKGFRAAMQSSSGGLVDWENVREVAFSFVQRHESSSAQEAPAGTGTTLKDEKAEYAAMYREAVEEVASYTGLEAHGLPQEIELFSRTQWIDANIETFQFLFSSIPMTLAQDSKGKNRRSARLVRALTSVQLGLVMGYLSCNVLGQFDLSIPRPEQGSRLYLVEANIRKVQSEINMSGDQFRRWITLHEVTHTFEFHCNNWLRPYITGLMEEHLNKANWQVGSRKGLLRGMRARRHAEGHGADEDLLDTNALLNLVLSPEQREVLGKVQAVMSVLEGYSNHVMDAVGERLLPSYSQMKKRIERRKTEKSTGERIFQRITGLDLKTRQYVVGERFVNAVVEKQGLRFMNRIWESERMLPTLEELNDPDRWIARIQVPRIH